MFGRLVDWTLSIGSLIGLSVTAWWTLYAGPNAPEHLQNMLQEEAQLRLQTEGQEWATVRLDGQHAFVSGQSPTFEATEAVIGLLNANLIFGGITNVTSEIVSAPPISPYVLEASLSPTGELKLTGHAPTKATLDAILVRAEDIAPSKVVTTLKIGSGEPLGPWEKIALQGLGQLGALDEGQLKLRDSSLSLDGQTFQLGTRAQVSEALKVLPAPYTSTVEIAGPGLWSVRHQEGALVLSGQIDDEDTRAAVMEIAQANFAGPVRDEMRIGSGNYEDWLVTVQSAMPQFARFDSGAMIFAPEEGGFLVRGSAAESTLSYLAEDIDAGQYPVRYAVSTLEIDSPELAGIDLSAPTRAGCQSGFEAIMAQNQILFETASATIDRASGATLDKIIQIVRRCPDFSFEVRGHTDASGDREANIELSLARAEAVKTYLVARNTVANNIDAIGLGPDVPIGDNETETGRASNRRIEFTFLEEG